VAYSLVSKTATGMCAFVPLSGTKLQFEQWDWRRERWKPFLVLGWHILASSQYNRLTQHLTDFHSMTLSIDSELMAC
jgi:hypothetical protein